jgi:hypothetical protein
MTSNSADRIPLLKGLSAEEIVSFDKQYKSYILAVESANRGRSASNGINIRSFEDCIDPDLLESLKSSASENQTIKELIDSFLKKSTFADAQISLALALDKVKLDTNIDPLARVIMFQSNLKTSLREHGMDTEDVFDDPTKFGKIVNLLVNHEYTFQPLEIRAWIKHVLEGEYGGKITHEQLSKILLEKIQQVDSVVKMRELAIKYYPATRTSEEKRPAPNNFGSKKRKFHESQKTEVVKAKSTSAPKDFPKYSVGHEVKQKKVKLDKIVKCWGCQQEGHSLKECTIVTTEAERQTVVNERKEMFKNIKQSKKYVIPLFSRLASVNNTEITIKMMGHSVNVILDDGSDRSLVSRSWLHRFKENHQDLHLQEYKLDKKHNIALTDPTVKIDTEGYVMLSLQLPAYEGLNIRNIKFFIVNQDIGMPIIGHSELHELGIHPLSTLERLQSSSDDIDEVEAPEVDPPESLEYATQQMLNRAKSAGMPENWWKKLCKLVGTYKDIFRVRLESDPPAEVTPMDVHIKQGY